MLFSVIFVRLKPISLQGKVPFLLQLHGNAEYLKVFNFAPHDNPHSQQNFVQDTTTTGKFQSQAACGKKMIRTSGHVVFVSPCGDKLDLLVCLYGL